VEVFCNAVAGVALVPSADLLEHNLVVAHRNPRVPWDIEVLRRIGAHFNASAETVARRLLSLHKTTESEYGRLRAVLAAPRPTKKKDLRIPLPIRVVSRSGRRFATLVLDAYRQRIISGADASEFLEAQRKYFPAIAEEAGGRRHAV
jgi:Zn-dependent peptidase ImmA (M78 family)